MIDVVSRNFDFDDVHIDGTERIAEAVAKYDVDRFIHFSSYNARVNSPSRFYHTKVHILPCDNEGTCLTGQSLGSRRTNRAENIPRYNHYTTRADVWS